MKKATFEAIKTALTNFGFADEDILAELDKEINKGAEAKAKNAEAYESIHDLVVGTLTAVPVTCAELFESIEKIARNAGEYPLYEIDGVWITQYELDMIATLEDDKLERIENE